MKTLLLSIKPEYVDRILLGTKKYEYRKRLARDDIDTILIYSTAPTMKVVASVQVVGRLSASPTALWEKTKTHAGISREKFRDYFRGCQKAYAYELGNVSVFDEARDLIDYGIVVAPQSFVYIDNKSNKNPD